MRKHLFILLSICLAAASCSRIDSSVPARFRNGLITLSTPAPEKGQQNALGLTAEPMDTVRVGFIGVGMRGGGAVYRFTCLEGVKVAAVCDIEQKCVDKAVKKSYGEGITRSGGICR